MDSNHSFFRGNFFFNHSEFIWYPEISLSNFCVVYTQSVPAECVPLYRVEGLASGWGKELVRSHDVRTDCGEIFFLLARRNSVKRHSVIFLSFFLSFSSHLAGAQGFFSAFPAPSRVSIIFFFSLIRAQRELKRSDDN